MTRFARPLRVELGGSPQLVGAVAAVHALAAVAVLLASLPLPARLLLVALCGGHFLYILRRQLFASTAGAIAAVAWDSQQSWQIRTPGQGWQQARLKVPVLVTGGLVVMRFRLPSGRGCSALVTAERLPADAFRRLRVRLLQTVQSAEE